MNTVKTQSKKNDRKTTNVSNDSKGKRFPFLFLGILFILLCLLLSSPSIARGWGLNHMSFWETPVIIAFYAIMIALLCPPVNRKLVNFFTQISRDKIIAFAGRWKYVLFVLIAVGAGFAFHALQVKYVFLGDCGVRPAEIERGEMQNTEYLARYIPMIAHRWLHAHYGYTVFQSLYLASNIAGGLFIFFALLTANLAGKTFLQKAAFFAVSTLSLAALMQFCGYAEVYAFPLLSVQVFLFLCVLHLQGKSSVVFPVIGWLFAMANHFVAACLLPALAFLLYRSVLWKWAFFRKKQTLIALAIILIPVVIYGLVRFKGMMLPFSPGDKKLMTMFSIAHYKEFFNSQLLGGGIVFLTWLGTLLFLLFKRIKVNAVCIFFIISSLSIVIFTFLFNMWRGSGDWDIYSFAAVVSNMATAFILLDLHHRNIISNAKYGILLLSCFGILHSGFWIATNHTDKSIGWVEKAFATDPASYYRNSFSNESMLGAVFSSNNLSEKSLYWEGQAYLQHQNDPRTGFNYANILIKNGKIAEARRIYEQSVVKFPGYPLPYAQLVNLYLNDRNYEALYKLLLQMEYIYKQEPQVFTSRFSQEQMNGYFDLLEQLRQQIKQ